MQNLKAASAANFPIIVAVVRLPGRRFVIGAGVRPALQAPANDM